VIAFVRVRANLGRILVNSETARARTDVFLGPGSDGDNSRRRDLHEDGLRLRVRRPIRIVPDNPVSYRLRLETWVRNSAGTCINDHGDDIAVSRFEVFAVGEIVAVLDRLNGNGRQCPVSAIDRPLDDMHEWNRADEVLESLAAVHHELFQGCRQRVGLWLWPPTTRTLCAAGHTRREYRERDDFR